MPNPDHRIAITFDIVTPESAEAGDVEKSGWIDKEGVPAEPDEDNLKDTAEDMDPNAPASAVYDEALGRLTAEFLRDSGATEPSSSQFHDGVWYSSEPETDYSGRLGYGLAGATETRAYHLEGYTRAQQADVFDRVTN